MWRCTQNHITHRYGPPNNKDLLNSIAGEWKKKQKKKRQTAQHRRVLVLCAFDTSNEKNVGWVKHSLTFKTPLYKDVTFSVKYDIYRKYDKRRWRYLKENRCQMLYALVFYILNICFTLGSPSVDFLGYLYDRRRHLLESIEYGFHTVFLNVRV